MPELPEVETVARSLRPHLLHAVFDSCQILRPNSLHKLSLPLETILGQEIISIDRRAKLLLLHLAKAKSNSQQEQNLASLPNLANLAEAKQPNCLAVHLRMTGALLVKDMSEINGKHWRVIFTLKKEEQPIKLVFDDIRAFGTLFLGNDTLFEQWNFWHNLGPEPLDLPDQDFITLFAKSHKPIKTALLDQQIIAGIGNIYADESLFQAQIHPETKANTLTEKQLKKLNKVLKAILQLSIEQCGSSVRNYLDANGNAGSFQNTLKVYGRAGQACLTCATTLEKIKLGGRSSVFCPNCQKKSS